MTNATIIQVELLSGRYHAHVWGESQFAMAGPEWPPSPWRLLRALASAWFCAQPVLSSEVDRDDLLQALGRSDAPEIWLPRTSVHEIRYYQPVRLGASDRVPHHDHFAVPEGGRFWFRFEKALQPDQRALLAKLLERLRYFGRSESRARLRLVNYNEPPAGVFRVMPRSGIQPGIQPTSPTEYRRVLCTTSGFWASDLWLLRRDEETRKKETRKNGYPLHLVDELINEKMPLPCGARWVEYAVPAEALVHEIRPRVSAPPAKPSVNVAEIRFRLNRRIPIPLRYVVAVARAFRDAAVEAHRDRTGQMSLILSGRELDGTVARGHQHAYYLPRPRAGAVTLDELLVRVPGGKLTQEELDALLGVGRIRVGGRSYPITVVPEAVVASAKPAPEARQWQSVTPFLPPLRHRQGREETRVDRQAIACAEKVCGRRPAHVESLSGPGGLGCVSPVLAHEYGTGGRGWTLTTRLGFWLQLTFDEPVSLDRPLGADAHFGAGQFAPVDQSEET
ncbi:type I-U CRISPR-associated protein Csb2 [Chloracidobacterium aggregatum]|uniref:Type I-U CRISPR-associated protein Cas5/Cas6 n=1 Tax=Chloracidobacterium sp. N TaxID=2821540 RepID=A0ABX8B312_9BACT|nr:type I-U CRISPR-associated protein Csb2 [Chloracidobacterium aggregatum]QUV86483.1 type I-U CRISPR-associated protein Cas5/Cas6 [Chloracidobacterium sp. 2]QUV89086.1 type I-U CRISPR-associated protein Cas5/Cas6 [Chloracidobacterium sp. S]QUV92107.1 type I-U CRISPR-associated protein Cas5/Cas6 [Chloracidobacterium sp. A]QUV95380.1 type I-U CRISPR-associated protein Cas5/Cas6 [Chloracidobacterium sp. N]QUV98605.1 type I-U CRISPR-associated protein Cas5/Cas6 [Chloracidobacterium sp. E]